MNAAAAERLEFAPPPPRGIGRALALAILVYLLLLLALIWGVHWRESTNAAVEAELWSSVPQEAAPRATQPPPPPPAPAPKPTPAPTPQPPCNLRGDTWRLLRRRGNLSSTI